MQCARMFNESSVHYYVITTMSLHRTVRPRCSVPRGEPVGPSPGMQSQQGGQGVGREPAAGSLGAARPPPPPEPPPPALVVAPSGAVAASGASIRSASSVPAKERGRSRKKAARDRRREAFRAAGLGCADGAPPVGTSGPPGERALVPQVGARGLVMPACAVQYEVMQQPGSSEACGFGRTSVRSLSAIAKAKAREDIGIVRLTTLPRTMVQVAPLELHDTLIKGASSKRHDTPIEGAPPELHATPIEGAPPELRDTPIEGGLPELRDTLVEVGAVGRPGGVDVPVPAAHAPVHGAGRLCGYNCGRTLAVCEASSCVNEAAGRALDRYGRGVRIGHMAPAFHDLFGTDARPEGYERYPVHYPDQVGGNRHARRRRARATRALAAKYVKRALWRALRDVVLLRHGSAAAFRVGFPGDGGPSRRDRDRLGLFGGGGGADSDSDGVGSAGDDGEASGGASEDFVVEEADRASDAGSSGEEF